MPSSPRVTEHFYYDLDVDRYLRRVGLPFSHVERALGASNAQLTLWRASQRLPALVWKRAQDLWGHQEMRPGEKKRVEQKPFLLPASYTDTPEPYADAAEPVLSPPPIIPPVATATPTPPDVIEILLRFIASLSAEKALLIKENFRLQRNLAILQQDQEIESDLAALDRTIGTTQAPEDAVAPAREALRKVIPDPSLLRQIEERLPFLVVR
jgi:hypothetical protein